MIQYLSEGTRSHAPILICAKVTKQPRRDAPCRFIALLWNKTENYALSKFFIELYISYIGNLLKNFLSQKIWTLKNFTLLSWYIYRMNEKRYYKQYYKQ